ncbi:type I methionyl aminopeptidase [Desulfomicrobium sp. ZS1]|uniref:type I methionyl aminopeptidase n=1 Tax=Desulfomicrobium sp. ZS1 TaxID=2952228 RepID=UPI0020B1A088|nr:type I methionyl aminopeptidase [Desulfomicrobium sp. ZS1]UTF49606.1 type I methionyl aminopeptidase [Desulfomicrobium sp. ZS1]
MKKHRGIFLKNTQEIAIMREVNRIAANILNEVGSLVAPGVTTWELEEKAIKLCASFEVIPAFKGYLGFPYALCCSVNEEIVHGFPSKRELVDGDIVSIDFGVKFQGFYGDTARTFPVGSISQGAAHLLDVTLDSLKLGIEQAVPGNDLYDVSRAVQERVEAQGFSVIKRFVGHGIGRMLHEKPEVPNFVPKNSSRLPLKPGMVIAIEPMVAMGTDQVEILSDGWTAVTKDRSLSAHFEHSVAITKDGPFILSQM